MVITETSGRGRGFASMPKDRMREIASKGGITSARILKTAHKWTSEEAAAAGRIGGTRGRGKGKIKKQAEGEEKGEEEQQDE